MLSSSTGVREEMGGSRFELGQLLFGQIPKKVEDLTLGGGDVVIVDFEAEVFVFKEMIESSNVVINVSIMSNLEFLG